MGGADPKMSKWPLRQDEFLIDEVLATLDILDRTKCEIIVVLLVVNRKLQEDF